MSGSWENLQLSAVEAYGPFRFLSIAVHAPAYPAVIAADNAFSGFQAACSNSQQWASFWESS